MELKTFDRGKMALFAVIVFTYFLSAECEYQCEYLEHIGYGWYASETLTCEFGCCGELLEQRCCEREEVDHKHWIIGISVVGGLLAVSIIVIIILCILKKKNLERAKICTGDRSPAQNMPVWNTANGFQQLNQTASSPPPPYTSGRHDIFVVGNGHVRSPREADRHNRNVMSITDVNTDTGQSRGMPIHPPTYSTVLRGNA